VASVAPGTGGGNGKASGIEVAGPGTGEGGGTALAQYLTLVDWKIRTNWTPLATGPVSIVRFRVLRSGQVKDIELETSSGNASVDNSALRAVRQSSPLPPFPNLLTEATLDLRYRFIPEP
jgi:TonB family protein